MMLRCFSSKKPALPHANKALSQPIRSWLTMPVAMSTCLPASVHYPFDYLRDCFPSMRSLNIPQPKKRMIEVKRRT